MLTKDGIIIDPKIENAFTYHAPKEGRPDATIALQSGMAIEEISRLLGHEKIDTTMIYAHASLEAVRAGHQKYVV